MRVWLTTALGRDLGERLTQLLQGRKHPLTQLSMASLWCMILIRVGHASSP